MSLHTLLFIIIHFICFLYCFLESIFLHKFELPFPSDSIRLAIKWSNQGTLMWRNVTGDVLSANCHWKHESQNFSSFYLSRLHLARLSSVQVSHSVLSDALGPQTITPLIPKVEDLRRLLSITHFASLNIALYFLWQSFFFFTCTQRFVKIDLLYGQCDKAQSSQWFIYIHICF